MRTRHQVTITLRRVIGEAGGTAAFSKLTGIPVCTVNSWVSGKAVPRSGPMIHRIYIATGLRPEELFYMEEKTK